MSLERIEEVTDTNKTYQQKNGPAKPYFLGVRDFGSSTAQLCNGNLQKLSGSSSKLRDHLDADTRSLNYSVRSEQVCSHTSYSASTRRASRHVDLLDAQGIIKPYNFRTRVQATGTRDYGEDVAERNMGENGVDVLSPAAQAFYASTKQLTQVPVSKVSEELQLEESDWDEDDRQRADRRREFISQSEKQVPKVQQPKQPRDETSGRVALMQRAHRTRSLDAPTLLALTGGSGSRRAASVKSHNPSETDSLCGSAASMTRHYRTRPSRNWISTERGAVIQEQEHERLPHRESDIGSRSRSISPPCVPRYRPSSSMSAVHRTTGHRNSFRSPVDKKYGAETDVTDPSSVLSSTAKYQDMDDTRDEYISSESPSSGSASPGKTV